MLNEFKEISLSTISDGALEQLFQRELGQVFKNIDDANTDATAAREVNLKIKLKPNQERDFVNVEMQVNSKQAPVKTVCSSMHIVNDKGQFKGYQKKEEQLDLVTSIRRNQND